MPHRAQDAREARLRGSQMNLMRPRSRHVFTHSDGFTEPLPGGIEAALRPRVKESDMQARMTQPALLIPEAMQALLPLGEAALKGTVPLKTHLLVQLRASQINGCGFCVDACSGAH